MTEPFSAALDLPTPATLEEAVLQRNAWVDSAMRFSLNEEFYRNIVVQIGEMFGREARIADDGSEPGGVLCLKVPELVQALILRTTDGGSVPELEPVEGRS